MAAVSVHGVVAECLGQLCQARSLSAKGLLQVLAGRAVDCLWRA